MKCLAVICCLALLFGIVNAGICREGESAGSIVVTIVEVRASEGGAIVINLFDGEEHWLKSEKAFVQMSVPVTADSVTVELEGLPYGDAYAIQVFHDQNENGRFDMRRFPYPRPKEGAGVSNNRLRFGPPDYNKARFELFRPSVALRIRMNY